jgi:hypothetical protein
MHYTAAVTQVNYKFVAYERERGGEVAPRVLRWCMWISGDCLLCVAKDETYVDIMCKNVVS